MGEKKNLFLRSSIKEVREIRKLNSKIVIATGKISQ
jgi:hypothetical protein